MIYVQVEDDHGVKVAKGFTLTEGFGEETKRPEEALVPIQVGWEDESD